MKNKFLAIAVSFAGLSLASAGAAVPEWVVKSNKITEAVMDEQARFFPEWPSSTGKDQYDTAVADLGPKLYERTTAQQEQRLVRLRETLKGETDAKVRQDIEILVDSTRRQLDTERLHHEVLIPFFTPADIVNFGLSSLLDPRNKPERQAKALVRLKRYAGLEQGYTPIATNARALIEEELARPGLIGPYIEEVKRGIDNTDFYLKGLAEQFRKANLQGWEADLETLGKQLHEYNDWVRRSVMPRARKEVRLPPAIYADKLKQVGVDIGPEELIERAGYDFQEIRDRMQVLGARIAQVHGWPSKDYRDVIRELKKQQLEGDAMLTMYKNRLAEIERIIERERLVTLPKRAASIRVATDAEAARTPAPNMRPPRLIGNTGEYGEFLIPLRNPHAKTGAKMDDYTYDAAAWTLTAHEARPGHELQWASMVERGVSLARAIFAFNSANAEGWALYAEALMVPYEPPEGQLIALQFRLLRMARAFLDPMVNLGRITPEQAKRVLMDDVVMSEPFAQQEADRYAFEDPGQATSYYYGYLQLQTLRTQAEIVLARKFDLKAFDDFVLEQGMLPPRLLKRAIMEEFVPAQSASSGT
jgi:uncharacterized protein (DUF885 family)